MIRLRKKRDLEEISAASMSDIAFLLLVFFMVASVFYVKEGIMSSLPKKESAPRKVERDNVYIFLISGKQVRLKHPSFGEKSFADVNELTGELEALEIANLSDRFALISTEDKASVQDVVNVLGAVRKRGFLKISLQKYHGG